MISSAAIYQRSSLVLALLRQNRGSSASMFHTTTRRAKSAPTSSSSTVDEVKSPQQQQQEAAAPQRPLYATRASFERSIKDSRINREATAETGIAPTAFQKALLLGTFLYSSRSHIPKYVPNNTIQRMHDRTRVVFIVVASSFFFALFLIFERRTAAKVEHDRQAGKVVTKIW